MLAEVQAGSVDDWVKNDSIAVSIIGRSASASASASASVSASASAAAVPKQKSQEDIDKKAAKKQRQRETKADAKAVAEADPGSSQVAEAAAERQRQREKEAADKAREERKQVTYTGMPVAKALPRPRSEADPGSSQAVDVSGSGDVMEVDYGSDDDGNKASDKPGYTLSCVNASECNAVNLLWSQFLLTDADGDSSWQGHIWGHCQPCSGLDAKTFKRECKKRREARAQLMRGRVQRSRSLTMSNAEQIIGDMLKGTSVSKTRIRELAVLRTKAVACQFIRIFGEMNEFQKRVALEINDAYKRELEKAAADISYATNVNARTLTDMEASYLTVVGEGVTMSFVCRFPDCLFFGRNDAMTWPQEFAHYWFRCPRCGRLHSPGSTKKGQIDKLAYVIMLVDPETQAVSHIPTVWPPSEEKQWLNNMIELQARDIQTPSDLDAWYNRSKLDLHLLIEREQTPKQFQRFEWDSGLEFMMSKYNFAPIKERGFFYGAHLDRATAEGSLFSNWTELISLCANVVASTRVMLSNSRL